jgi:CspA family cold shock protein
MEAETLDKTHVLGKIKWFNNQKAFGFIELPGGGLDVFVHANQLRKSGITRVLKEGETVRFLTSKGPKGSFAVDISIVDVLPEPAAPEPNTALQG